MRDRSTGDIDVMGEYDGDGKADVAVFRPSAGAWFIVQSSNGVARTARWGTAGDIPLSGDVDGDGKDDLVVYRPRLGTWYFSYSTGGSGFLGWGSATDIALLADPAIFRPSTGQWFIKTSGGPTITAWVTSLDVKVSGDFDGDGKSDSTS
jgi:hypothetical protein